MKNTTGKAEIDNDQLTTFAESPYTQNDLAITRKYGPYVSTFLGLLRYKYFYWKQQNRLKDGFFYLTVSDIENYTGFSKSTIIKITKLLKKEEIIEIRNQPINNDKFRKANYYKINYHTLIKTINNEHHRWCAKNTLDVSPKTPITNKSTILKQQDRILSNSIKVSVPTETSVEGPARLSRNEPQKKYEIPAVHDETLSYYYSSVSKTKPGPNTKTLREDSQVIRKLRNGTMFETLPGFTHFNRKYSYDEIKALIDFHKLALTPGYDMPDKKYYKVYFHEFVYNKHSEVKSWFCRWLKSPPQFKAYIKENPYPEITEVWQKNLTNGKPLKPEEMNKLIDGAKRLVEFFNDKKLKDRFKSSKGLADLLWNAVKADDTVKQHITAGYLRSDTTFFQRLPDYCERQLIFEEIFEVPPLFAKLPARISK